MSHSNWAKVGGHRPGAYQNQAFGEAHVRLEGGALVVQLGPSVTGELEHWHHDTFRATWRNPYLGWALVSFDLDSRGRSSMLRTGSWWPDYRRVAEPEP